MTMLTKMVMTMMTLMKIMRILKATRTCLLRSWFSSTVFRTALSEMSRTLYNDDDHDDEDGNDEDGNDDDDDDKENLPGQRSPPVCLVQPRQQRTTSQSLQRPTQAERLKSSLS